MVPSTTRPAAEMDNAPHAGADRSHAPASWARGTTVVYDGRVLFSRPPAFQAIRSVDGRWLRTAIAGNAGRGQGAGVGAATFETDPLMLDGRAYSSRFCGPQRVLSGASLPMKGRARCISTGTVRPNGQIQATVHGPPGA